MISLFRHSRGVFTTLAFFGRTSATTSTPSGGARVQPSGASTNLSEASRAADGTDMAMRDAQQRGTSTGSTKPNQTGGQSNNPKADASSNSFGKLGFGLIRGVATYFVYTNYMKTPASSKSLNLNTETGKRDAREQSTESTGKKH